MALSDTGNALPAAWRRRSPGRQAGANWPWMLLPALLFFAAFWLLPFARLLQIGMTADRSSHQSGYWTVISQPQYLQSLFNTVLLSLAVTLITLLTFPLAFLGVVVGFLLHRWQPGQGIVTHQCAIGRFSGPWPFYDSQGLID